MTSTHYIDGIFVDDSQATIPANDLAVMRGYGVFDYLRTYNGKPFQLSAHLARLERSAQMIALAMPHPLETISEIVLDTLARNPYVDASVRIIITGGPSEDNITPAGDSRLLVFVTPFHAPPASWYQQGVKIITERTERYMPEAKTLNYIPAIVALQKARKQDAVDAIYVNREGCALEGTTTNLFAFYGTTLVTPSHGILSGITRRVVLDIASDLYDVQERNLPVDELLRADEVFITSTNKELCPVRQIDDTMIGAPGVRTQRLSEHFKALALSPEQV